jgi:tripartite-type tricarboxylate transporter receptor subunit TctC
MTQVKLAMLVATAMTAIIGVAPAQAGTYPEKVIRIVVPWPAGGLVDVLGRVLGNKMSDAFGQPVVVENRPGAGGNIGTAAVAKSAPDGYTLLVATSAHAMSAAIYKNLSFDPVADFTPIVLAARAASILVVHPSVPASSLKELITLARAQPAKFTYASAGAGTPAHLYAEMLKDRANVDLLHVAYKGAPPAMLDLLAGRVDMLFANMTVGLPQIRSGKLKALAVTSAQRSSHLPDTPTLSESGLPGLEAAQWLGVLGPRGLPPAIVEKLNAQVNKSLTMSDVKDALVEQGMEIQGSTPQEFETVFKADMVRWADVAERAGVKVE